MLTAEENELLSHIGPGTPAGELMRQYWLPFAVARELTDENPTRFVRLLGEDLVLFRDKSGNVGLIGDHCSHRGASLLYGRVEERGIACAYHGWLFNAQGHCLETPAEPADSLLRLTVRHKAYPVQRFLDLYWAYLGPEPAPALRLLSVEDNPFGRVVLNAILTELGHHTEFIGQGAAAAQRVAQGTFDAVLMDMVLPDISGIEAIKRIRALEGPLGRIAIIGVSGRGDDEMAARAAGADAFLVKPMSPRALATALLAATRRGAAAT